MRNRQLINIQNNDIMKGSLKVIKLIRNILFRALGKECM